MMLTRKGLLYLRVLPRRFRQVRWASSKDKSEEYDEPEMPNGFLFNEKPLLPGEKREKEYWENIWVYGMGFNCLFIVFIAMFKPDTSINAWARDRAMDRLDERDRLAAEEKQRALEQA